MTRRRPIRAAFVVTVSAAALACGGKTTTELEGGGMTTNPPPPPTCSLGDSCTTGELCSKPNVVCIGGVWRESTVTTNPPPPVCTEDVREGARCSGATSGWCWQKDTCAQRPYDGQRSFSCIDGKWKSQSHYSLECPDTAPAHGADCGGCEGAYPVACSYDGVGPCLSEATASCTAGTWKVTIQGTCNPPPPDAGL